MIAFIPVKLSHIELSLYKLKLASKPIYTHNIEGNNIKSSQLIPFIGNIVTTKLVGLLDPQYSQLCDECLERKEQSKEKQSLADNLYAPIPCNLSIPRADSFSAQPRL